MPSTTAKELASTDLKTISPDATLREAASKMKEYDCGCLLVGTKDKPEGIITDRDIVVRALSENTDTRQKQVRDHMTSSIHSCQENDTLEEAAKIMNRHNISRLVVKDDSGKTTGILTFGHILRENQAQEETTRVVACATGKQAA